MYYAWNNDNGGPPASLDEIDQRIADAKAVLGDDVEVVPSSLDAFVDGVPAAALEELPVVTADLEDPWIQGAIQAPGLLRTHRALQRAFDDYVAEVETASPAAQNFTRFLSKTIEHSFGASMPSYGQDHEYTGYSNADFHAARRAGDATYAFFERSWQENWAFGVDAAVEAAAGDAALKSRVDAELAALPPATAPRAAGFEPVTRADAGYAVTLGAFSLEIDAATGALRRCAFDGVEFAAPDRPVALLRYQTLTDDDFRAFRDEFLLNGADGSGYQEYASPRG